MSVWKTVDGFNTDSKRPLTLVLFFDSYATAKSTKEKKKKSDCDFYLVRGFLSRIQKHETHRKLPKMPKPSHRCLQTEEKKKKDFFFFVNTLF